MARWSKVEISGVNTSTLPVLSRDEAKALFIEAKAGSESARQTLIQGNLRLVLSVIKKFDGRNENPDDLFQVGCIGLIKGIDNFNPDMDVYPSTYLVPMILGEVRRYLRDSGSVRVSRSMRDTAYKVLQAKEKFIAEHQREPSVEEIAKILDIKREDVVFALDAIVDPVSLYEPIGTDKEGNEICLVDIVEGKNTDLAEMINKKQEIREMYHYMAQLNERERQILSLRYGILGQKETTQREIAQKLGISRSYVSRIEKNALSKLRSCFRGKGKTGIRESR